MWFNLNENIKIDELTVAQLNELRNKNFEETDFYYKDLKIQLAQGGIAVFDGVNTIILNKNLLKYPRLLINVLEHEIEHYTDVKKEKNHFESVFNIIKTELKDFFKSDKHGQLTGFQLKHPESNLPFMRFEKKGKKYTIVVLNQLFFIIFLIVFVSLIVYWILFF